MAARITSPCPGSAFLEVHPKKTADKPFYDPQNDFNFDHDLAVWTIAGIMELDGHPDVLTGIAHDRSFLDGKIDMYPRTMNGWKSRQEKEKVFWEFLSDFEVKT